MTIVVQDAGSIGEHVADAQLVLTSTVQFYEGDTIVVVCCCDNAGVSGATSIQSITASKTLTWNLRQRINKTGGIAADGADIGIWEAEIGPLGFAAGDTVTVNFSAATTCKTLLAHRIVADTNKYYAWFNGNFDTQNGDGYPGATQWQLGQVLAGDVYIFAMSSEGNIVPPVGGYQAVGTDENGGAPATNCHGLWTQMRQARCDTTTGTTHLSGITQAIPITANGNMSWHMGFNEANDRASAWIALRETNATVPAAPPGTPANSINGAGSYLVQWTSVAPSQSGHRAVDLYHVYYDAGGGWTYHSQVNGATASSASCGGFGPAANVRFGIYAHNAVGWSALSTPTGYVQMWNVPNTPVAPTVTPNGVGSFSISWTAPANGGTAIDKYSLYHDTGSGMAWTGQEPTGLSITYGGYSPGQVVSFAIYAHNAMGWSNPSAGTSSTAWQVPSAPPTATVTPQGGGVYSLAWSTPASNGGTQITDYIIEYNQNGGAWTVYPDSVGVSFGLVLSGLNDVDLWAFRVKAVNAVGQSGYSPTATSDNTAVAAPVSARGSANFIPTRTPASTVQTTTSVRTGTAIAAVGATTVVVTTTAVAGTSVTYLPAIARSATALPLTEVQTATTVAPGVAITASVVTTVSARTATIYAASGSPASAVLSSPSVRTGTTVAPVAAAASAVTSISLVGTSARYVPTFIASGLVIAPVTAGTGVTFAATIKVSAATPPVTLLVATSATLNPIETAASIVRVAAPVAQTGIALVPNRAAASFVQAVVEVQTGTTVDPVISATGLVSVPSVAAGTSAMYAVTLKINSTAILSTWATATGVALVPTFGAGASVTAPTATRTAAVYSPLLAVSASLVSTSAARTSLTYAPGITISASVVAGGMARLSVISLPTFGIGTTLTAGVSAGISAMYAPTFSTTGTALPVAPVGVGSTPAPFARFGVSVITSSVTGNATVPVVLFGVGTSLTSASVSATGVTYAPTFVIIGTAVTPIVARTSATYSPAFSTGPTAVTTTVVATSLTYVPLRSAASFVTAPVIVSTGTIYAATTVVFSGTYVILGSFIAATSTTYVAGSSTDRTAVPASADGLSVLYAPTFKVTSVIVLVSPVPRTGDTYPVSYAKTGTATPPTLVRTSLTYATVGEGGATFVAGFAVGSSVVWPAVGSVGRFAFPIRKAASSQLYDPLQLIALVVAQPVLVPSTSALYVPTSFDTTALVEVDTLIEATSLMYDPVYKTLVFVTAKRVAALGDTLWEAYDFDFAFA